jgi:hypothetical protein
VAGCREKCNELQVSTNAGNFLTSRENDSFSRRTVFHKIIGYVVNTHTCLLCVRYLQLC